MTWLDAGLTPKQARFAHLYVETLGNGPEAAEEAYNTSSRDSARRLAHRNLHNPRIRRYIEALLLDQRIHEPLVESILRHLNLKKTIQVNGTFIETDDSKAQGEAQDRLLKMFRFPV